MKLLFAFAFALTASGAAAQEVPDWAATVENPAASQDNFGPGPPPPPPPPPSVPLDGGLGVLALAGAAYAARRLSKSTEPLA